MPEEKTTRVATKTFSYLQQQQMFFLEPVPFNGQLKGKPSHPGPARFTVGIDKEGDQC